MLRPPKESVVFRVSNNIGDAIFKSQRIKACKWYLRKHETISFSFWTLKVKKRLDLFHKINTPSMYSLYLSPLIMTFETRGLSFSNTCYNAKADEFYFFDRSIVLATI